MINDWRLKWFEGTQGEANPLFPFGFVQVRLPPPRTWAGACAPDVARALVLATTVPLTSPICACLQLAPDGFTNVTVGGFPVIRWAQTADFGYVPNPKQRNVFMACAIDLGDPKSPYGSGTAAAHSTPRQQTSCSPQLLGLRVHRPQSTHNTSSRSAPGLRWQDGPSRTRSRGWSTRGPLFRACTYYPTTARALPSKSTTPAPVRRSRSARVLLSRHA